MKKLLLLPLVLFLSNCALYNAYTMTGFDNNEYQLISQIRLEAQTYKNNCDDAVKSKSNAIQLTYDTRMFMLYSEHIPHNDHVISASKDLHTIAEGLSNQYVKTDKVSPGFCKIKFTSVETSANTIQKTVGSRPR
jgi:hypothetical protein